MLITTIFPFFHNVFYPIQGLKLALPNSQNASENKQEGHDGPVSLHWLIREIHSYQTLHYLGIGLKHTTPYKD